MFPASITHSLPVLFQTTESPAYQTCPYCGFRLMEVWPSTDITSSSRVEHCPICGYQHDIHGLIPAKPMTRAEKLFAFDRWLWRHSLDRRLLQSHYHVRPEQFFSKGAL